MSRPGTRAFERVLILMFENQYRGYVMQNPYMRRLAALGAEMANYFGVMHPSQTNYIASIAGELCNVTDDDPPPPLSQATIVDLIEDSPYGLDWRAYMDGYVPQNTPWTPNMVPKDAFPYVIKHNPFSSFSAIVSNRDRWAKIENEAGFWKDLARGELPAYAWFTPDMWHDGHYLDGTQTDPPERAPALVDQLAAWLEGFFGDLRFPGPDSLLPPGTLVVVTFDEADYEADWKAHPFDNKYTYDGPNQIYTTLLGDMIQPGTVVEEGYNHYSLIRTIEHNFGLGSLGKNDREAAWFRFLWGEAFGWHAPTAVPFTTAGVLTAAPWADGLAVVTSDADARLWLHTYAGGTWAAPTPVGQSGCRARLAAVADGLTLVYVNADNHLTDTHYTLDHGWSAPTDWGLACTGDPALCPFANGTALMAAWRDADGRLQSRVCRAGTRQDPVAVPFTSDGPLTLARLGASLFLIFQRPGTALLDVVTYNTAAYNVVTLAETEWSGPYDDTTVDQWSPSAFPVAHYTHGPYPATPDEPEPLRRPYPSGGQPVTAALDGVIHLVHAGPDNPQLQTTCFSIAGVMTPKLPISYNSTDQKTTNSGYGTLAQAGWSTRRSIHGAVTAGPLTLARGGDTLHLLFQGADGRLHQIQGGYSTDC